jgi:hypothetical protein
MRQIKPLMIAALCVGLCTPAFASWQDEISNYDQDRLSQLAQSREDGLVEAAKASRSDRAAIHGVLDPKGRPVSASAVTGTWSCRMMKLGGLAPAVVYDWFRCRVRQTKNGLYFEKVTGSLHLSGYLDSYEDGRFVLLAAIAVKNESPRPYSGGGAGAGSQSTANDAVGVVSSIGPGHARIEFPYPVIESVFDVIELRR